MAKDRPIRLHYKKMARTCLYCAAPVTIVRVTQGETGEFYVATLCEECATSEMVAETERHGLTHLGGGTFVAEGVDWELVKHLLQTQDDPEILPQ